MKINILGTEYSLIVKKFSEDEAFERRSIAGYCDGFSKQIVVCDMSTYKGLEHEPIESVRLAQKQTVRHEIVHAFFNESGLMDNSLVYEGPWVHNEEAVDWIANQGEKILAAWQKAGALNA
jgi:hypothetical protein